MIDQHKIELFKELFNQSDSVLIIYAPDALRDHLFAATALYKTFQELGNKQVALLSSESLYGAEPDIVYLDETKTDIGHKNLCISLDYNSDAVEKITSAIDEEAQKLHITIKPKKGVSPLSRENISFSYTGAEADMVILVGVDDLESLDQLYYGYENLYQNTALVSINSYETSFGNLKLDILGSSCVSEFVSDLLRNLNYQLDIEVATNLLAGIDEETDNLESYLATADTFEIVSYLLRSGARRFARDDQSESDSGEDASSDVSETALETGNTEIYNSTTATVSENSETSENDVLVITEEDITDPPEENPQLVQEQQSLLDQKPKRGRGRPKGSRNKAKVSTEKLQSKAGNQAATSKKQPKPGDLDYVPSGLGPSAT